MKRKKRNERREGQTSIHPHKRGYAKRGTDENEKRVKGEEEKGKEG